MSLYREITQCRVCGSDQLRPVLSLGDMAISDFPKPGDDLDYAPLELRYCERCELVQLRHSVERDRLYRDYHYLSGLNETMIAALRDVATEAMGRVHLEPGDRVLDIGANDGTLLKQYPDWVIRWGFDPSNVTSHAPNVYIFHAYFPCRDLCPPERDKPKIITACAMFYDLDDPGAFLDGVKEWLHPDGVFVLQMPDLWQMLHLNAFDNICHEHVAYYPTRTLWKLAKAHGLRLVQMGTNKVNGGSVRYTFTHGPVEDRFGEHPTRFYERELQDFAHRVERLRVDTRGLLHTLRSEGYRIWAYGASTKGNTLLQYYSLGPNVIEAVADRNPDKWGRTTVNDIPIVSEEEFRRSRPDYALVLPWGFLDAFRAREADYLASGGQFIVPLPDLRTVGGRHADLQQAHAQAEARAVSPAGHAR